LIVVVQSRSPLAKADLELEALIATYACEAWLIRRYRRYVRLTVLGYDVWFHVRKEITMKSFERLADVVTFRRGIIAIVALVVLAVSGLSR
jgi:hypothetical protein